MKRRSRRGLRLSTAVLLVGGMVVGSASSFGDTFVHDTAGRLVAASRQGVTETFQYDGAGVLVRRCNTRAKSTTCTRVLYDEAAGSHGHVAAEQSSAGTVRHAHGPLGPTLAQEGNLVGQVLADDVGSVRAIASTNGRLTVRRAYDPFGNVRVEAGSPMGSFGYAGESTSASGLIWLRARHYAPNLGRFLQRDTELGSELELASLNRYTYAHANPLRYGDPSGRTAEPWYETPESVFVEEFSRTFIGFGDTVTDGATFGLLGSRRIRGWLGNDVAGLEAEDVYRQGSLVGWGVNAYFGVKGAVTLVRTLPATVSYLARTPVSRGLRDLGRALRALPLGLAADLRASFRVGPWVGWKDRIRMETFTRAGLHEPPQAVPDPPNNAIRVMDPDGHIIPYPAHLWRQDILKYPKYFERWIVLERTLPPAEPVLLLPPGRQPPPSSPPPP